MTGKSLQESVNRGEDGVGKWLKLSFDPPLFFFGLALMRGISFLHEIAEIAEKPEAKKNLL